MSRPVDWNPPIPGLYGSSFRLGEWIGGPVTPLFEDWALTRLEAAMHAAHRRWSGQPAPLPHHVVINGWYFYSLAWLPVTPRALLRWAPSLIWHLLRHPRRMAPIIPPTPASRGSSNIKGTTDRSWKSRMATTTRPCGVSSSCRSARTLSTMAVDDSAARAP